jgi:serine protease Do
MERNEMAFAAFGEVAERLRRSTVLIHSGSDGSRRGSGSGSGVICSDSGLNVTNAHVIIRGSHAGVQLGDGREFEAQVTEPDHSRDLAALRISAQGLPRVSIADSSRIRAVELALAIGNPLGFVGALSTGVVLAVGPVRGLGPCTWVQANVRLAPGNSGGPLANAAGDVIGINSMVAGRLALAIPSNTVSAFLQTGASTAGLGASVYPTWIPSVGKKLFALLVLEVQEGSPAATASLLPGDILFGTEEHRFGNTADLRALRQGSGARQVRLEFLRGDDNRIRKVTVLLGTAHRPAQAQAA